jgi:hypothetical protein
MHDPLVTRRTSEIRVYIPWFRRFPQLIFCLVQAEPEAPIPRVEAPIGAPLKNLVVHVGRPDPISLPDTEYPEWMWQLVRPDSFPGLCNEASGKRQIKKDTKLKIKANNTLNN